MNKKLLIIPGAAALGIGLLVGCGGTPSSSSSNFYGPSTAPLPQASTSMAPAFDDWYTGTGYADLQKVQTDLNNLSSDESAGNDTSGDGLQLAIDATAASKNPMPIDTSTYISAMQELAAAGNDTATGDDTDATTQLDEATVNMNTITTELQGMVNGGS
jgi:hypothetical protein